MHQARIVHGRIHGTEPKSADIVNRQTKLCVIEEVEELRTEVQAQSLPGSANCFMTEKSVLTKSGPMAGRRDCIPQLADRRRNKAGRVDPLELAVVGVAGVAISNLVGRFQLLPLPPFWKKEPDWLLLSIKGTGNPEEILWMSVTWKLPRRVLVTPPQSLPNCLPLPKGKS